MLNELMLSLLLQNSPVRVNREENRNPAPRERVVQEEIRFIAPKEEIENLIASAGRTVRVAYSPKYRGTRQDYKSRARAYSESRRTALKLYR